ncbi:jg23152, partial [Pararge aegeria aegeria]
LKISLNQLFVIIALTSAAAIALIITGIALSCYPKVEEPRFVYIFFTAF